MKFCIAHVWFSILKVSMKWLVEHSLHVFAQIFSAACVYTRKMYVFGVCAVLLYLCMYMDV